MYHFFYVLALLPSTRTNIEGNLMPTAFNDKLSTSRGQGKHGNEWKFRFLAFLSGIRGRRDAAVFRVLLKDH